MILANFMLLFLSLITYFSRCRAQVYLQNPTRVSIVTPLKYEVTLQVPIANEENPSNPGFIGSLVFEFQLNHLAEQAKYAYPFALQPSTETSTRQSFPIYDDSTNNDQREGNSVFSSKRDDSSASRRITFDTLIAETRLGTAGLASSDGGQEENLDKNKISDNGGAVYPLIASGSVKLSAQNLTNFENVSLVSNTETIAIVGIRQGANEVEFVTEKELPSGRYSLIIDQFTGKFGSASGVYFRNIGDTNTLISANLFPNMASSVFPCVDNFSARAQLQLTLVHPTNYTAISNTPAIGEPERLSDLWLRTKFEPTPLIPAYLFGFTLLPPEYHKATISSNQPLPLMVYTNSLTILKDSVDCLLDVTTSAAVILRETLVEDLALEKIDLILVPDLEKVVVTYGTIIFGENILLNGDEANMMYTVAQQLASLWIGGLTSIASTREYCFARDLSGYVAMKTVKMMTNNDERYASFRLANYLKIQIAENYMSSSESLTLPSQIDEDMVKWRCNLKGIVMLESLGTIIGEEALLSHIRTILRSQRLATFTLDDFLSLLRGYIVDGGISLAQTYDFWQKNGGFPAVSATVSNDTMRIIQLNHGRLAKMGSFTWVQMPIWPLRLTLSSAPSPLYFMTTEGLDLAPMPNYTVSMINLGFEHFYRVNYDMAVWQQIQSIMKNNPDQFTKQARAQLINDFCFFNSQGMHPEGNMTEEVRQGWVRLVRNQPTKFDLCEWYIYGCEAGNRKTATAMKEAKEALWVMEGEIREAFQDSQKFQCGLGASGSVANKMCDIIYSSDCL